MSGRQTAGFSLLEVMVAASVLAIALMAIFSLNAGAIASHAYAKKLSVASLLARAKMIELEQELYDQGFSSDDEEDSGDFSEEGWPGFRWRARILAPKTQGLTPEQLIGSLFNLPLSGKDGEGSPFAALFGGGQDKKGGANPAGGMAALGPAAGLAQAQFTQMVEQLKQSVREVHLTITWKDGKQTESIDLVTHVVSLGTGSDRNGGTAGGATSSSTTVPQGQEPWVRQDNGLPVANPRPGPSGQMVDPSDGMPCIPLSQYVAARGGGPASPFRGNPSLKMGPGGARLPFGNLPSGLQMAPPMLGRPAELEE